MKKSRQRRAGGRPAPLCGNLHGRAFLGSAEEAAHDSLAIAAPLHEVFSAVIQGQDLSPFINLVAIDEEGRGITPLPRRTRGTRARPRPLGNSIALRRLQQFGRCLVSGGASLGADSRPGTRAAQRAPRDLAAQPLGHDQPCRAAHAGPAASPSVIDNKQDAIWPDRIDTNTRYWYAPRYELIRPDATSLPGNSPFLFTFMAVGHDISGRPGLEATIQFSMRPVITAEGQAKLGQLGAVDARPVVTQNLSFALEIPFRDQQGNTLRENILASAVEEQDGRVLVTFRLLNDWVRLIYGSLAFDNFQPGEPARISAAYTFEAYINISRRQLQLAAGGKSLAVPLVAGTRAKGRKRDELHVTKGDGILHFPGGTLHASPMAVTPLARPKPPRISTAMVAGTAMMAHHVAVRPELQVAATVSNVLSRKQYAESTQSWRSSADLLMPCSTFGSLYIEETDAGPRAIGCQDNFHLGQTVYRLYEELLPKKPGYRVFRSLQTPGRFLVAPDVYVIGRYEPTEGDKAYRPLILFYSTIDIDHLEKSRCVFLATLQPDISQAERRQLLDELRADHHPQASLVYLTEIEGDVEFDWALPTSGAGGVLKLEAEETRDWDSFQVSLATDAIGVPQLKAILESSGIAGSVRLSLPDGTSLRSSLRLDLSRITGPWLAGPLAVKDGGGGMVEIHNAIESTVNLSELLVGDENAVVSQPVGSRLAPGAKVQTAVDGAPAVILPVYSIEPSPASLTEIRSYIEDISVGLILMNRLDLAALALQQIEISGEVQGVVGKQTVLIAPQSDSASALEFLLPLTAYLANPIVEFKVLATDMQGQKRELRSWNWPILTNGVVVEISRELVGL